MNYKTLLIAATTATLLMSGCDADRGTTLQDSLEGNTVEDKIAGYAVFNPTEGLIPYPNNILFAPNSSSTTDFDLGVTLNIPYEPEDSDANVKRQLNTLTGFSTISPITAPITATLDPASIPGGVQVYKVDINSTGAVTGIVSTLQYGIDYFPTQSGSNIAILPLQPLESLTNYMVVLTNDLQDASGRILAPDIATALTLGPNPVEESGSLDAATAAALEAIRQGNQAMFAALVADSKDPSNTVQIWNFRTQFIGGVQANIAAAVTNDANLSLHEMPFTTADLGAGIYGIAQVYDGNISMMPQYMPQADPVNYLPAIFGEFTYSSAFTPVVQANVTIPVVATVPNAASDCVMPGSGWPVVIYQHGVTRSRTDLFAFGETLAAECYAAVAIDLPLHGTTESNQTINPFYKGAIERTFNLDIVGQDADENIISQGPDGVIDSTGTHYMNLVNILTTRDNLQQTTSDLLELQGAIASTSGISFNPNKISFLSHSLGNIAAIGYLNRTSELRSAVMAMPGQGVIQLLNNSPVFSPAIESGLASVGIIRGTAAYDAFMLASQTLVDDADPANYAQSIGSKTTLPILEIESVGDGTEGSGDQHIPNSIASAPLSGTEPFIFFTGAKDINTSGLVSGDSYLTDTNKTVIRLTAGEHRSPLTPAYGETAFTEIHSELSSFIHSNGTEIRLESPEIIKQ